MRSSRWCGAPSSPPISRKGIWSRPGDVLYTIDSSDAANSVARAQLSLNQAQRSYEDAVNAQYVRTDIGGTVVSIGVAPGDVVTAGQEVATIRDESVMLTQRSTVRRMQPASRWVRPPK